MTKQVLRSWEMYFLAAVLFLPQITWARQINIGSIGSNPTREIEKFLPLARYLGGQLQSEGINQGKVVVARGIPQMAALIREGKVDLYIDSPFPSIAVSRLSGSKFLLRRWKKGIGEYRTVIFVRKDSGVKKVDDLKGKIIAFDDPFSSSGYFFPKMALVQKGLALVPRRRSSDPVDAHEVGYVFSYSDDNTIVWVLRRKVLAGAIDNQTYLKEGKRYFDRLKIICETFSIPRQIVSYRADLTAKLVARIKEILTKMDRSKEGKKTLRSFGKTTKFDELPNQSVASLLKAGKYIDAELGIK
ncbi:MAG: phosphate/phosphite/phosphonate ABC transporter substrate-binding protein [Thermodesulfobacteriota bacterium]